MKVNYVYFGIIFVILASLHIYHVLLIEHISPLHYAFYIFCAAAQCLLEIAALALISIYVKKGQKTFIILTFLIFLAHIVDFSTIRILGMTIWYIFGFIFAESLENFIEMLYATNLPIISWLAGGVAALALLASGVFFFRRTEKLSNKKPLLFSHKKALFSMGAAVMVLGGVGTAASLQHPSYIRALPWKTAFTSSAFPLLKVGSLKTHLQEQEHHLDNISLEAVRRPNIFLFIAESLREDFITPVVAPHLAPFKVQKLSLSAANGTHLSWFSIFHSVYPFYWEKRAPQQWKSGSLPLQMLKKAGYKIHVYSASRLSYYHMDERLFGEGAKLADSLHLFGQNTNLESHEHDTACMKAFLQKSATLDEGNLFVIFLDSTHFGYSWPSHTTLTPAPPSVDYLHVAYSNDPVEGIKNRYRNAIHFVDTLFGQFLETLNKSPTGKEAVIVFTGDHGEEFFEEGCIFHASNLSPMQTQVPLYLRLGSSNIPPHSLTSHLDIFPTLLHHVFGKEICPEWFDGESLLKPRRKNFVITARYNASRDPTEFLIHHGKAKLWARFKTPEMVECLSHRDGNNLPLSLDEKTIRSSFQESLDLLFPGR
jgi:glucan phosphoethanolaminetransferase (alkaline phosphatase superfamily)